MYYVLRIMNNESIINPFLKFLVFIVIFCYPSLTEGFGISLLEAMASGCATISSIDIGQQGIKIEPKNTNQIVNSIKYLINNEKEAKRIGINNRKIAKKFTWKKFIDDYSKLYESLTK